MQIDWRPEERRHSPKPAGRFLGPPTALGFLDREFVKDGGSGTGRCVQTEQGGPGPPIFHLERREFWVDLTRWKFCTCRYEFNLEGGDGAEQCLWFLPCCDPWAPDQNIPFPRACKLALPPYTTTMEDLWLLQLLHHFFFLLLWQSFLTKLFIPLFLLLPLIS